MLKHNPRVLVLMYHSISNGNGATCTPPELFTQQLEALRQAAYHIASLTELHGWFARNVDMPARTAVITFDDAFADFASEAAPRLREYGYRAAVFAPTGRVGARSDWDGEQQRPLLSWEQIRALTSDGFEFGSHAVSHTDLTALPDEGLRLELAASRRLLEEELGRPARFFAAPFGKVNDRVCSEIRAQYEMALGVRLGAAEQDSDRYDVPRIDMHYFRRPDLWSRFLEGKGQVYFVARKFARSARALRWDA